MSIEEADPLPQIYGPFKLKSKVLSAKIDGLSGTCFVKVSFMTGLVERTIRGPPSKSAKWDWEFELFFGGEPQAEHHDNEALIYQVFQDDVLIAKSEPLELKDVQEGKAYNRDLELYGPSDSKLKGSLTISIFTQNLFFEALMSGESLNFQPRTLSLTVVSAELLTTAYDKTSPYVLIDLSGMQQ